MVAIFCCSIGWRRTHATGERSAMVEMTPLTMAMITCVSGALLTSISMLDDQRAMASLAPAAQRGSGRCGLWERAAACAPRGMS